MKLARLLSGIVFIFTTNFLYAGNPAFVKTFSENKDWSFVENKGQVASSEVRFYGHQGGVYLYCKPGMLSFVFTKVENDEKISEATRTTEAGMILSPFGGGMGRNSQPLTSKISTSRTDLVLSGSNPNAQIIAADQQE